MEGLMGDAARYPTANVKAFANLPWQQMIMKHLKNSSKT